jgi:CHAD domain-containing protein
MKLVCRQLQDGERSLRGDRSCAIHAARKNVKKARAALALLEEDRDQAVVKAAQRLRGVAHAIATLRDADAAVTTFDQLRQHFPGRLSARTYAMIRSRLVRAQRRAVSEARRDRTTQRAARVLHRVRASARDWRGPALPARALHRRLEHSYRATRNAMRAARKQTSAATLHKWRRRLKTFWYHLRLVEALAPTLRIEIRRLKQLETWLGDDHNLSMLQVAVADAGELTRRVPGAVRELAAMSATLQGRLRRKEFALGKSLLAHRPGAFVRRLRKQSL